MSKNELNGFLADACLDQECLEDDRLRTLQDLGEGKDNLDERVSRLEDLIGKLENILMTEMFNVTDFDARLIKAEREIESLPCSCEGDI